ncbi:NAD-dependent epimerase/dehydratase family protein [Glycomyces sp. L485]|uniref:NAD-dependent epimerase/dehydratase family protein n=1 Tax=Glycomyces sp. L485 TaxID=2909235 RepID=UPI001F4B0962|nr:NAD-dependent epimerase/dehydratase family protein [Glycomyces sp. L485]MCH7232297.1 NAD-dependent epimerase/dehydratase family protein [Glycomyces sp. L485]
MRVLVTGGAGFIGGQIVEQLAARGDQVVVLDSLAAHEEPPEHLPDSVELLVGDLGDERALRRAVEGVDAVCHQAARVGLGVDFDDVSDYVADNDLGTANLLRALWRRSFTGRLVVASSMVVYGEGRYRCPEHGDVRAEPRRRDDLDAGRFEPRCGCGADLEWAAVREDARLDPRNVYAATKVHTEHLSFLYGRESEATVCALRYHNVYGPRMPRDTPYAGVASIFRSALEAGKAPRVFEDGNQTRDFVHVRDVARANLLALDSAWTGAANIASGEPHSVGDMARALAAGFTEATEPVVTGEYRLGDVRHVAASPDLAAEALGFRAETGFAEGMADFAHDPLR